MCGVALFVVAFDDAPRSANESSENGRTAGEAGVVSIERLNAFPPRTLRVVLAMV